VAVLPLRGRTHGLRQSPRCHRIDPGFGLDCWPAPEIAHNVNTEELGNLELTPDEERDLVAFMKTLTDGHRWPSPFASTPLPPFP
jgi:hypothetical protein